MADLLVVVVQDHLVVDVDHAVVVLQSQHVVDVLQLVHRHVVDVV